MSDIIHEIEGIANLYKNQKEINEKLERLKAVTVKTFKWIKTQGEFNKDIMETIKLMHELISEK